MNHIKTIQQGAEKSKISSPSKFKILAQGAEAKILLDEKNNLIIKDRISKSYRHPALDKKIRKKRTKSETKLLEKASALLCAPKPLKLKEKEFDKIKIPYINGKKLSEHLDNFSLEKQKEICKEIGSSIAKLHKHDIIHGDLTTSNMILIENHIKKIKPPTLNSKKTDPLTSSKRKIMAKPDLEQHQSASEERARVYFIDFGLGYISKKTEDKAVDLHLLKQALEAKHFKKWEILLKEVFKEYEKVSGKEEAKKIFERIIAIEKRGRYRH